MLDVKCLNMLLRNPEDALETAEKLGNAKFGDNGKK